MTSDDGSYDLGPHDGGFSADGTYGEHPRVREPPEVASERDGVPEGIDPRGVPALHAGRDAFVLLLAVTAALLVLIFTLGWVVYHHLAVSAGLARIIG